MNQANQDLEKIKEKIAKLLRKSESAQELNSMAEATAFANKANDLLMQYNIKLADINREAGLPTEPEIIIIKTPLSTFGNTESRDGKSWMISLINIVNVHNLCTLVLSSKCFMNNPNDPYLHIFGTQENIDHTSKLSTQLIGAALNLCDKAWKTYNGSIKRGKFRRDFLNGFNIGLNISMKEHEKQQAQEVFALMRTNEVALTNKVSEVFNELKKAKSRRKDYNEAAHLGLEAGKNIKLNEQIS